MLFLMVPASRAGWVSATLVLAAVGCGSVVVQSPGTGGVTTTGSATGGSVTVSASSGAVTSSSGAVTSSSGAVTSSSGAVTSSSSGGVGDCNPACGYMLTCCNGTCVEFDNDPFNCGGCGVVCPGPHPYCHKGACEAPTCAGQPCPSSDFCCGTQCCAADTICCDSYGGPLQANPHCAKPENGTCPKSCYACQ